jgi:hypothetical protein
MKASPLLLPLLAVAGATLAAGAPPDYLALSSVVQTGEATFYNMDGLGDTQGACSFSDNFANTNGLPWTKGVAVTIALNDAQFASGAGCGLCVRFRGTGEGLGTTPLSAAWTRGFVNNRCPECAPGDLDFNAGGDGRWRVEWVATPCGELSVQGGGWRGQRCERGERQPQGRVGLLPEPSRTRPQSDLLSPSMCFADVGASKLQFNVVASNPHWATLVISNTAVPVASVEVQMDGAWQAVPRSFNNQWAVHGAWEKALPLPIRVTSLTGEVVEDKVTGAVTKGTVQFTQEGDVKTGAGAPVPGWGKAPEGRSFSA